MSREQLQNFKEWVEENSAGEKPVVILPSGGVTISDCAGHLFGLIGATKTVFGRGGAVATLRKRDDGLLALDILKAAEARFTGWR